MVLLDSTDREETQRDGMKNTLEILHGMKSTLNAPKLNITLATRALRLGLKITLTDHSSTTIPVLLSIVYWVVRRVRCVCVATVYRTRRAARGRLLRPVWMVDLSRFVLRGNILGNKAN